MRSGEIFICNGLDPGGGGAPLSPPGVSFRLPGGGDG